MGCLAGLIIILLSSLLFASGNAPVFLRHPQSMVVVSGTNITFTCTSNNTDEELDYIINNTKLESGDKEIKPYFMEIPIMSSEGCSTYTKTLKVTALSKFNNTNISCQADSCSSIPDTFSEVAVLRVQGHLSSIVNLSHYFIDSSTVNVSWSPPFTLPGTDITGYIVSTNSYSFSSSEFSSTSYHKQSLLGHKECAEVTITVSGYNGLDGENSTIRLPSPDSGLQVEVENDSMITIYLTTICPDLVPSFIAITLSNSSGSIINTTSITVSDGADVVTYDGFNIPDNMTYTLTVSYTVNGYTVITITDIQGVTKSSTTPTTIQSTTSASTFITTTKTASLSAVTSPTTTGPINTAGTLPTSNGISTEPVGNKFITIIVPVVVAVVVLLFVLLIIITIVFCCYEKSSANGEKRQSSDNIEDRYKPNKEAKTANAPIVYAELSGFNKPKNNTSGQPAGNQTKKDDGKVVYSDLEEDKSDNEGDSTSKIDGSRSDDLNTSSTYTSTHL